MSHIVYSPADGESRTVTVFGLTFQAGKPVEVGADVFARLSTNPTFEIADKASSPVVSAPKAEPVKVDGRSKAARNAREEEARARAAAHAAEVAEAKASEKEE